MSDNTENKQGSRPRRMINVAFPPAKYGLYVAIAILVVVGGLMFFQLIP